MPRRTHSETVESLVNIARGTVRFRSSESAVYFRIPCGEGHQTVLLDSEIGRAWLTTQYLETCHEPPSRAALAEAIDTITRLSLVGDAGSECPLRISGQGNPRRPDAIYIDPRAEGRAIEITASGYRITHHHTADFRASFHQETLPDPEEPSDPAAVLDKLRSLLNLSRNDRSWIHCLLWLLAAFRPAGPYPPLVLHGPAASGKSTAARMLRALVDPNRMPLRAVPRSPSALADLAWHNHVLAFDDITRLPPVAESNLARLASGGAFELRHPRLDFSAARPLLFTTRNPRLDLGGRAIQVELPEIAPRDRRTEADLFEEFEALRPQLGAILYNAVSAAIARFGQVQVPALPRHADAALWLLAAAPSLGLTEQDVLAAINPGPPPDTPGAAPHGPTPAAALNGTGVTAPLEPPPAASHRSHQRSRRRGTRLRPGPCFRVPGLLQAPANRARAAPKCRNRIRQVPLLSKHYDVSLMIP